MRRTTSTWIALLATAFCFLGPRFDHAADNLDFAVIQPGQPGSPEEARPVMDALAAYIQKKTGVGIPVRGIYFNQIDPALDFLHHKRPLWGIVGLGFYSRHAATFGMVSIAATRPSGHARDAWRVVASKEGPDDWKGLRGAVLGNMLFEKDAAACLLFGMRVEELSFSLQGTFEPLRAVRNVVRGKAPAAVLDQVQYAAIQEMPLAKEIKVLYVREDLPTSPVVWFGRPDARTERLTKVLVGMKDDNDAQSLLKLLQTDGFGPPDEELRKYTLGESDGKCFQ